MTCYSASELDEILNRYRTVRRSTMRKILTAVAVVAFVAGLITGLMA